MSIQLRKAMVHEAGLLSELTLRSKAHWGYSAGSISAMVEELSVKAEDIQSDKYHCIVALNKADVLGYFALTEGLGNVVELDALFVDTDYIGQGVGRLLMEHAIKMATDLRADKIIIQSDPYAAGFYEAAGGKQIGERESGSIPGRYLPLLEILL